MGAAGNLTFQIGSVDAFERQMVEAQQALGVDALHFIPVGGFLDLFIDAGTLARCAMWR